MGFDPCRFRFFDSFFFSILIHLCFNDVIICYFCLTLFIFLRKSNFFLQDQIPEFFTVVFRSHFSISFRFYDECYIYQIKMFERHNLFANRFEIIKLTFKKELVKTLLLWMYEVGENRTLTRCMIFNVTFFQ